MIIWIRLQPKENIRESLLLSVLDYHLCRLIWTWINPKHSSAGRRPTIIVYMGSKFSIIRKGCRWVGYVCIDLVSNLRLDCRNRCLCFRIELVDRRLFQCFIQSRSWDGRIRDRRIGLEFAFESFHFGRAAAREAGSDGVCDAGLAGCYCLRHRRCPRRR